jgi:hypothetical protein
MLLHLIFTDELRAHDHRLEVLHHRPALPRERMIDHA